MTIPALRPRWKGVDAFLCCGRRTCGIPKLKEGEREVGVDHGHFDAGSVVGGNRRFQCTPVGTDSVLMIPFCEVIVSNLLELVSSGHRSWRKLTHRSTSL